MSECKCPMCGADEDWYDMAVRHWSCGSSRNENMKYLSESGECLRRQLAQRDERIRELEDKVERLTEENAHMRTMLKAASAIALMDDD